jgi:hypothetical protein
MLAPRRIRGRRESDMFIPYILKKLKRFFDLAKQNFAVRVVNLKSERNSGFPVIL